MYIKKFTTLLTVLTLFLCGCTSNATKSPDKDTNKKESIQMRAVWISYYDYYFVNMSKEQVENEIDSMTKNICEAGFNNIFLHVRANADSIYPSKLFPFSERLTDQLGKDPGYDILKLFIDSAHKKNLKIHAWINPYRISASTDDITTLSETHIARKWATSSDGSSRVISYNGGLYFNPADTAVQKLVLDGVREIIDNYNVDGIHFDDYFYPVSDVEFDITHYENYKNQSTSPLPHGTWRITNISALIQSVHKITKERNIVFGVSPSADINGKYLQKNGYADIQTWLSESGYVDYIIPQIYWGFEYPAEEYRFDVLAEKWSNFKKSDSVKLYAGLAAYKVGTEDNGNEWVENTDILSRQANLIKSLGFDGFSVFSYSYFFSQNGLNTAERLNLISNFN